MEKVTILTGPLAGHGGEETVIKNFVQLLSRNYEFELLLSENIGDTIWLKDVDLVSVFVNENHSKLKKLIFILKGLRNLNSNLVICMTPKMVFLAKMAKVIFHLQYDIISWIQFSIQQKFSEHTVKMLKQADYHMAINSDIKNNLISIGVKDENIALIYNPVKQQSRVIQPSKQKKKLLCVSRIQYAGEKNLNELIRALANLVNVNSWELDIYGADDSIDQIETKKLKSLISDLGLEKKINWCGFKKNLWSVLNEADCLILTSTGEGFGMVLCEAISYGIPVISSNCPSGPSDIVNSKNGFLYPMGDIYKLGYYIKKIVNGEVNFRSNEVKASISEMYEDEYKNRVESFLFECLN